MVEVSTINLTQWIFGLFSVVASVLGAWALRRVNTVDVLVSQVGDSKEKRSEQEAKIIALQTSLTDLNVRLYAVISDLAVLRAQVNGVNGNNGLNGTLKMDQQRIAHLTHEVEGIKMTLVRLEMSLEQHRENEEHHR